VPTMTDKRHMNYAKQNGFTALTLPYDGRQLQFLILLPDELDGLAALEKKLTPGLLSECAQMNAGEVILFMPTFKLEPPLMALGRELRALGMTQAFDEPRRSANFDRMAPRRPDDYLFISEVFHKTFMDLDEKGTEAAAATAVAMAAAVAMPA